MEARAFLAEDLKIDCQMKARGWEGNELPTPLRVVKAREIGMHPREQELRVYGETLFRHEHAHSARMILVSSFFHCLQLFG